MDEFTIEVSQAAAPAMLSTFHILVQDLAADGNGLEDAREL